MAVPILIPTKQRWYSFVSKRWLAILLTFAAFACLWRAFKESPSPGNAAIICGGFVAVVTFFKLGRYEKALSIAICAGLVWIEIRSISKQDKEHAAEIKETQNEIVSVLNNFVGKDSYPLIEPMAVAILSTDATHVVKYRVMANLRNIGPNQLSGITYRIFNFTNVDIKSDIPVFIAPGGTRSIDGYIDIEADPNWNEVKVDASLTANNDGYNEEFYFRVDPANKDKVQWRYDITASWTPKGIIQNWKTVVISKRQIYKNDPDEDASDNDDTTP